MLEETPLSNPPASGNRPRRVNLALIAFITMVLGVALLLCYPPSSHRFRSNQKLEQDRSIFQANQSAILNTAITAADILKSGKLSTNANAEIRNSGVSIRPGPDANQVTLTSGSLNQKVPLPSHCRLIGPLWFEHQRVCAFAVDIDAARLLEDLLITLRTGEALDYRIWSASIDPTTGLFFLHEPMYDMIN